MNPKKTINNGGKILCPVLFLILFWVSCLAVPPNCHALQPGDQMIHFQATALDGRIIDTPLLTKKGPVMIVFWASWCSNCLREIPQIKKLLQTKTGGKLQVITVNVGQNESMARIRRFIEKTSLTYPVILDQKSKITSLYGVIGVPTLFIANPDGKIVYRQYFVPDEKVLQELLP